MEKWKEKYVAMIEKYATLKKSFDLMLIFFLFLHVFGMAIQTTSFRAYSGSEIAGISSKLMLWVVILRLLFYLDHGRELIFGAAIGLVALTVNIIRPDSFVSFFAIAAIGTVCIDFRKLLKGQVLVVGLTVLVSIVASTTGTIENLVYLWDGDKIRDSFGICYPTDFASYLFFLLVFFWIAWDKIPHFVSVLLGIVFLGVARGLALSDTCLLCGIAFLICIAFVIMMERGSKNGGWIMKLKKLIDLLLIGTFPIFAAVMFVLVALYGKLGAGQGMMAKLNVMLTGRLELTAQAIEKYGISLLGTKLSQQGNGFSTFPVANYDFVDSTYPLILLQNGIIFFVLICLVWTGITYLAVKKGNYRLAFAMSLLAFHGLAEHHFIEEHYNLLLFIPCAVFAGLNASAKEEVKASGKRFGKGAKLGVCLGAVTVILLLSSPWWLAILRTICGVMRREGDANEKIVVTAVTLGIVLGSALLGLGIAGICDGFSAKTKNKKAFATTLAGVSVFALLLILGLMAVNSLEGKVKDLIASDAMILRKLEDRAGGSFYGTEFPAYYKKELHKMKYDIFTGEDLGRKTNATVIVPRGTEYYVLLRKGFFYVAISDETALYVKDAGVLECLKEMGYEPKDYFDETRYVELPINTAPASNLRKGVYQIEYVLERPVEVENAEFAEITIVGDKGYTILEQRKIDSFMIDDDFNAVIRFKLELSRDTGGVMFYVIGLNGFHVNVKQVSYKMISH